MRWSVPLTLLLLLAGCTTNKRDLHSVEPSEQNKIKTTYARGFTLEKEGHRTLLTVKDPWQNASGVSYEYLLSDTLSASQIVDEYHYIISTPVRNVVCLSTTHIGFLDFLHEVSAIRGVSGKELIVNSEVIRQIDEGLTFDVGYDENLNYELLLKIKPDVVFAYGINASVTKTIKKLGELGIPVVMIGEYLEEEPLAKMEWIKVFAALTGHETSVASLFDSVAARYDSLSELTANISQKPSVLLGLPYRGTWYVSGAQSYIARLVHDAGGWYLWDQLAFNESRPMNLESVFENAMTADLWLNTGDAESLNDIVSVDPRFRQLPPFKNGNVFNNNKRLSRSGGNGFYESGVTEPDVILSDLIYIFHPQLLPSHKLTYYQKLR
jgi:iron complex transport system substrate-binding protein